MRLLPAREAASEDADLLCDRLLLVVVHIVVGLLAARCAWCSLAFWCSDRFDTVPFLALTDVLQGSTGTSLFRQSAVEDDGLCVFKLAEEGRQPFVELVRGNPAGSFDVASNVVYTSNQSVKACKTTEQEA